jgi:hypothetical protein
MARGRVDSPVRFNEKKSEGNRYDQRKPENIQYGADYYRHSDFFIFHVGCLFHSFFILYRSPYPDRFLSSDLRYRDPHLPVDL